MQDDKLVNIGSTSRNGSSYSVEFHEDKHYPHVKRVKLMVNTTCDTQIIPNFVMIAIL